MKLVLLAAASLLLLGFVPPASADGTCGFDDSACVCEEHVTPPFSCKNAQGQECTFTYRLTTADPWHGVNCES